MQQTAVMHNMKVESKDQKKVDEFKLEFKDPNIANNMTEEEAELASDQVAMFLSGGSAVMVVSEEDLALLQ